MISHCRLVSNCTACRPRLSPGSVCVISRVNGSLLSPCLSVNSPQSMDTWTLIENRAIQPQAMSEISSTHVQEKLISKMYLKTSVMVFNQMNYLLKT